MPSETQVRFQAGREREGSQQLLEVRPRAALPVALPAPESRENPPAADALGEPLTIREVSRLLGCSVWTVRQRCLPQGLPYFRVAKSGKLIFYRSQVIRWILEKQKQKGGVYK
jgi:hypothetical protein